MVKDYLNNKEKQGIIGTLKIMGMLEEMADGNLFSKEEKKNIRTAVTLISKSIIGKIDKKTGELIQGYNTSVLKRLNPAAAKSFNNSLKSVEVYVADKYEINTYKKRVSSDLDAAYEDNKDYFNLCELILDKNCKNCNRKGSECEFYKAFEEKCIPEFDGGEKCNNCKYAFKTDNNGKIRKEGL